MALLIFSHGNSFPASTYGVMTASLKQRGFNVQSIEKLGHDAAFPVTNNWPHLVSQLAKFTQHSAEKAGESAYLVGHSLGGLLSMLCAAQHPEYVRGVVLLDAPVIGGWKAAALGFVKRAGLVGRISPGAVSQRRKDCFANVDEAYAHFKSKRAFALWDDQALRDYVTQGTFAKDGKRFLSFEREIETQIYNTLPSNLESVLRRNPLRCPVAFIGGLQSNELRQTGTQLTQKITQGRMHWLDGTHLFPMEKPIETAAAIETAIHAFSG